MIRSRALQFVLVVAVVVLGASGCGGESTTDTTTPLPTVKLSDYADQTGQSAVTIQVIDNSFRPQFTKVSPGTKVTFRNLGRNPHNVISVNVGQFTDIPTDAFSPGQSGTITVPDTAGEVPFYCSLHGTPRMGMNGRLLVVADKG
ncbi:MAG: cupredoxin domain-containing protein [Actinomycetes bacterium]